MFGNDGDIQTAYRNNQYIAISEYLKREINCVTDECVCRSMQIIYNPCETCSHIIMDISLILWISGHIRNTVLARWTVDQQCDRSILHQGHDSYQISSHCPKLPPAQYQLTVQNRVLKYRSFHAESCPEIPVISCRIVS